MRIRLLSALVLLLVAVVMARVAQLPVAHAHDAAECVCPEVDAPVCPPEGYALVETTDEAGKTLGEALEAIRRAEDALQQ